MDAITIFDWVVIAIVGLSALLALFRGFIREVLSLATWIIAAIVTINYYDDVIAALYPEHVTSKLIASGIGTIGLYMGLLLILSILSTVVMRFLKAGGETGMLDSLLGMVFGVLRGLFIVALSYLMLAVVMPEDEQPEWLANAKTLPLVQASADVLSQIAPGYVNELGELSKKAAEQANESDENPPLKEGQMPVYRGDDKIELEKLIQMLEKEESIQDVQQTN